MLRHQVSRVATATLVILGSLVVALGAEAQGYSYYALTPCRLVDTREVPGSALNPGQTGWSGKLQHWQLTFVTSKGKCGVPATGVEALSINVTVVTPPTKGFITLAPANAAAMGQYSTINFSTGDPTIANGAIVPIQSSGTTTGPAGPTTPAGSLPNLGIGDFGLYFGGGAAATIGREVNIVVDVTGYFAAP